MIIFTVVFGRLLKVPSPTTGAHSGLDELPGLPAVRPAAVELPVEGTMSGSMAALLGNAGLIKKVYFPRELLPFSPVLSLDWLVPDRDGAC